MRKIISLMLAAVMAMALAGCSRNNISKMDIDQKVEMEQVNDSSALVVRAFFESIFNNDREMFEKCFPESFINELKEDNIDMFDQYSQGLSNSGTFAGTQYINYNELSEEGGYADWEIYRDNISEVQGIPSESIESMQIVWIKVYFTNDEENQYLDIYSIAYRTGGAWYMYEIQESNAEFNTK